MSDVIVSTTESTTDVTTTNDVTTVAITDTTVEVSQATAGFQGVPGSNSDPTYVFVRNSTGALLPKGSIVYVSGANGVHTQVSLALATGDVTSARTLGWLAEDIANNASGLCCVEGYLDGVNTQGVTEGAQLYLSPTVPGGFQETKPSAPDHMVYVGIAAKVSAGNGRVFVHIQNGAELEELHDVKIVSPQNNDLLRYVSGTALWENVASTAITAGSAITAGTAYFASLSGTATTISGSITKSQVSDFTSGTVASAGTSQQAGTAFFASTASTADYATTSGTSVYSANSGTAVTITGSITRSQVSDFTSGTVASASTALTAGTASFASQAATAVYSDTSGTAVTISGTITNSQVSDFASGTVANISGTVTQAQVSGLGTALAGKAGLADNNTFTGTNTFNNFTTFQAASDAIPIRIFGANGQSADLFSVNDYLTNTQFEILSDGRAQSLKGIIATVSGTASIPLVVRGTAGQSANITEWQSNAGGTVAFVDSVGRGVFPTVLAGAFTTSQGAHLALQTTAATNKGIIVRGAASQSANYFEIQDSTAGTVIAVNSAGSLLFGTGLQSFLSGNGRILTVASSTAIVPMTIRGASGQTANLQEWQNSGSTVIAKVDKNGAVSANYFGPSATGLLGYLDWTTNSPIFNSGGTGVVGLIVKGAASQSANLLEIQRADNIVAFRVRNNGNFGSGGLLTGTNAYINNDIIGDTKGLIVRGASGQTANLQEWQNNSGSVLTSINSSGGVLLGTAHLAGASPSAGQIRTSTDTGLNYVDTTANASPNTGPGYTARRARGTLAAPTQVQSGDLLFGIFAQGYHDAAGFGGNSAAMRMLAAENLTTTALGSLIAFETASTGTTGRVERMRITGDGTLSVGTTATTGQLGVVSASASRVATIVRGAASQSANLLELQDSSASTVVAVNPFGAASFGTNSILGRVTVSTGTTGTVGMIIRAVASQTADYFQAQTSAGATAVKIDSAGDVTARVFRSTLAARIATSDTTVAPMVISTIAGQTSNSTEWQTNAGTVAYMQAAGNFKAQNVATFNSLVQLAQANSGGVMIMGRATAQYSSPGANSAALYFRDGTNAGTLKLVVRAGTAGAETTILDNIPT